MIGKIIRIAAASTVSLGVTYIFIKGGIMLQVPLLEKVWGVPLTLSVAIILIANVKIWNEKDDSSLSLG
jgi:hypothetical protein